MSCIQDILRDCRRIDDVMSKEDYLLCHPSNKPLHSLFSSIGSMLSTKLKTCITECKRFEDLNSGQIFPASLDCFPEVTSLPLCNGIARSVPNVIRYVPGLFRTLHASDV